MKRTVPCSQTALKPGGVHRIRQLFWRNLLFCAVLLAAAHNGAGRGASLGLFEAETEIGHPAHSGSVDFNLSGGSYEIAGGGANMWFTNDSFHFVWKRLSGDFSLQAGIEWLGTGGNAHRKACLLIRQDLSPESAYVDIAVHGNGLTSLQFRDAKGGLTHEIEANVSQPARVGIERQDNTFFIKLAETGSANATQKLGPGGAFIRLPFTDPVYVGLGVCAHDDQALERARFTNVELQPLAADRTKTPVLHCALEIVPINSKDRRVVYYTTNHIEAPNWSRDGKSLLFNANGHIHTLPVGGGDPKVLDTGFANRCNNDHGFSPDGTSLAISDQSREGKSLIYVLPANGGTPHQLTKLGPSYWHGWSPDGSTIAYCAERNREFDIYTMPAAGGEETRLTTAQGLDDGPDYTADGKFIYFNSERSGSMQIWRMRADGSQQEQITSDEFNNWFPHPSPDGKWLVFLTYEKGVSGHPANQEVRLRLMPLGGGAIQDLARLFGGQGTINVSSWSPDSKQLAFVSYELIR